MTENEAKEIINNFPNWNLDDQWLEESEMCDLCETVINALQEIKQYRSIGTVEECREAVERQKPKKVRISHNGALQDRGKAHCPNCGLDIHGKGRIGACFRCGQAISLEEREGEDD